MTEPAERYILLALRLDRHDEACLKETGLVRDRGLVQSSIVVVPTPQSLVSDGLAEVGPPMLLDGDERATYADLVRDAGVDTDFVRDRAVAAAVEPVQRIGADAGRLMYEHGWSTSEVLEYLERWASSTAPSWRTWSGSWPNR